MPDSVDVRRVLFQEDRREIGIHNLPNRFPTFADSVGKPSAYHAIGIFNLNERKLH